MYRFGFIAGLVLALGACVTDGKDGEDGAMGATGATGTTGATGATGATGTVGPQLALPALYTTTNAAAGNQVSAYLRSSNGSLSRKGGYTTSGAGLGAGLGSQGSIAFDAKSQRFFAVNAGGDSISMLQLDEGGDLTALSTVASGGKRPVSIAVHGDLVYVANQGDLAVAQVGASISGFRVVGDALVPIADSTRPLSATGDVRPTDIGFARDGSFVIVAERFASKLDTFKLVNGVAQPGSFQASAGMQPFAFDWSPEGFLVVAEVGSGAAGGSSASSYALSAAGALTPVTSALPTLQSAACWLVMAGGYAYIANAASANITGVTVSETGALTLHDATGVTATTGAGAIDLAVSPDHGYLYSLASGPHMINIYAISADGSLAQLPGLPNAPATAAGLVAR